jgi:general secretion pathway protein G
MIDGRFASRKNTSGRAAASLAGSAGFTLIELMVVIVILGILAAIMAPRIVGRTDEAKVVEARVQIANLETALKLYKLDNGRYPTTEQGLLALVARPAGEPEPPKWRDGGYLERKSVPKDPWGNAYAYLSPGLNGDFDVISYGADAAAGGTAFDADISNSDD